MENLDALQSVAGGQTLPYGFVYWKQPFDVDLPVLVLSHAKSLVRADIAVPLTEGARTVLATRAAEIPDPSSATPSFLSTARSYLATVRGLPFTLHNAIKAVVEGDLASARSTDPTLTMEDMSRWLSLARLNALSHGDSTLTAEVWVRTRDLELARRARIAGAKAHGGASAGAGAGAGTGAGSAGFNGAAPRAAFSAFAATPHSGGAGAGAGAGAGSGDGDGMVVDMA